jgi:hypothetical protein
VYAPNPKLAGTILTQYLNADGYYSASGFYVFAKPFAERKYTLFFNGNASYINNVSYISQIAPTTYELSTEKNLAKSLVLTQGIRFRMDITDVVNAELNTSYSLSHTDNSLEQANINNNFQTINLGISGKNYLWKDWTLSYDYTKTINKGYQGATNPNILNAYVERRFLKGNQGTIRLSAFDLFNQNAGYTNTSVGTYNTQSRVNRLGRYALLSFTFRLSKFSGTRPGPGNGGPGFGGPGGPPPGGE